MKIDAHVHFWQLARGDYGWMTADMTAILRGVVAGGERAAVRARR